MARYVRPKKKTQARSGKKHTYKGVTFSSGLELFMWKELSRAGINAEYESESFELMPSFTLPNESWERKANGKGEMLKKENVNIRSMKYTPDFIIRYPDGCIHCIIETKGYANEAFPLRWKLFKQRIKKHYPNVVLFKPQKQAECLVVIERILELRKNEKYT